MPNRDRMQINQFTNYRRGVMGGIVNLKARDLLAILVVSADLPQLVGGVVFGGVVYHYPIQSHRHSFH